jgi:hypothetical protein
MDPDPDPTPFSSDFKDATKKIFFFIFFCFNLPAGTSSSVLKIEHFAKILCKNPVLQALFQKREGSGSAHLTNGSGSF